jgi:serine/threonine protein kinase
VLPHYANVSQEAEDFVLRCLKKNPEDRATISELINHQFFKKYPEKEKKAKV